MPLRVSWSFDESNKSRSKMYRQGHYAKLKKPSRPELFEDASRILDELLRKQLEDNLNAHGRPPRFFTHPLSGRRPVTTGEVLDERDELGLDEGIERCKTMPSRMRGNSPDEPLLPKELDALKKKTDSRLQDEGSNSSADTEGDSSSVSGNRKKKGLLRRAKDRFLHSIHRQEREKENKLKDNDSPKSSPKKQARKSKTKSREANGVKDKGDKRLGGGDSKDSVLGEGLDKRRNSVSKALMSLRKSFRSRKEDRRPSRDEEGSSKLASSAPSSTPTSKARTPTPDHDVRMPTRPQIHQSSPPPPPPAPPSRPAEPPTGSSLTVPATDRKGSGVSAHEKSASPFPYSSSSDSRFDNGDKSSSLYSIASKTPHAKNVLDDPGDDIEFMDENDDVGVMNGGGSVPSRGRYVSRDGRTSQPAFDKQTSLVVDGESDVEDGRGQAPGAGNDLPVHERTEEEKDQLYGKIAQKLIHMADSYAAESGMSDADTRHGAAAAPDVDGALSELERKILLCLRDAGDRNANVIGNPTEEIIEQTKAETYERFKDTVQHSLGNDVSWNQLAFLFYTTKGVMSAVGTGSQMARVAKEMTLQYFSDKFAKWLMDRGGFDSVLSDSDSELD